MRTFESHLEFDLVEARDTSEKNPYYYVAYAHARICSIFRKATEFKLQAGNPEQWQSEAIDRIDMTPERQRLLRLVARFPEEVADAAANLEPHRLVNYLFSLAMALSKFYGPRENKIIEQDPDTAGVLLDILDAVRVCLRNGLRLLGMSAPEQMTRAEDAD
ncbi:MAG: arginine--tRNA ligase, partial [Leptospiraceae bacterium]|nr:arginine--tRNA ligase [Leptospiraceae bacterium]